MIWIQRLSQAPSIALLEHFLKQNDGLTGFF
jgi:hypothetical protein